MVRYITSVTKHLYTYLYIFHSMIHWNNQIEFNVDEIIFPLSQKKTFCWNCRISQYMSIYIHRFIERQYIHISMSHIPTTNGVCETKSFRIQCALWRYDFFDSCLFVHHSRMCAVLFVARNEFKTEIFNLSMIQYVISFPFLSKTFEKNTR